MQLQKLVLLPVLPILIPYVTAEAPSFSFPTYPALSYASPILQAGPAPTYAPSFEDLAHLVKNRTTTKWATIASPTDSADKFGNLAWSSLWVNISVTAPPFTTTASPTSMQKSEVVKPTPLPFPVDDPETSAYTFPSYFLYGFTSAAVQIEGAVKNEGRGPTYVELITIPSVNTTKGGGRPDITTLNYYLYKQDIARLAAVGVKTYAFSISWSRILPFAVPGSPVNQEAIDHYDDLINTVLEYGMTPVVTLQHLDTPLPLATRTSFQGWDHPDFVESFLNYAQIVLVHYSDRVGTWVTFNEPTVDAAQFNNWASGYNIVMAHAKVVHWYRDFIKGSGKWSLKLAFSPGFALPLDPTNSSDVAAAIRRTEFDVGHIANPLFLGMPIPVSVSSTIGEKAPTFTTEELAYVNGTCDYLAFDLYTTTYHTSPPEGIDACAVNPLNPLFPYCTILLRGRDGWEVGTRSNTMIGGSIFYQHMRTVLQYLNTVYPAKDGIMITEIGFPIFDAYDMTIEQERVEITQSVFYQSMLNEVLKSIHEDQVNVTGFLGWSYVNNWEWGQFDDHYGVQAFNKTTLERFYKRSIFDFVDFIDAHSI